MGSGDIVTPIVIGVMLGGLYALIALGLSLVFGVMRLINLAHGDLVILSSYIAYALLTYLGIDPIIGLVICIPFMFVLGIRHPAVSSGQGFRRLLRDPPHHRLRHFPRPSEPEPDPVDSSCRGVSIPHTPG